MPTNEPAALIQTAVTAGPANVFRTPLTKREHEVLYLMAEGLTTKAIAAQLKITFKTASCHRGRILQKLHVGSTVSAVRWAIRERLIER